jgi:hypothetical protein
MTRIIKKLRISKSMTLDLNLEGEAVLGKVPAGSIVKEVYSCPETFDLIIKYEIKEEDE